jgi:hypothetical protein
MQVIFPFLLSSRRRRRGLGRSHHGHRQGHHSYYRQTCSNHANFSHLKYRHHLVSLLHQTYRHREKCTTCSLLNFLFYFEPFYLLFYSSYILCWRLRMTRQTTSSTTSSIASEEARSAAILGTTKRRCLHMCSLWTCIDVILSMDVMLCMDVMNIVMFELMCWIL